MENFNEIEKMLAYAGAQGRKSLSEPEVYRVLELAGLEAPKHFLFPATGFSPAAAAREACEGLPGDKAVLKLVSSKTLHKTEAGGVKVCDKTPEALGEAMKTMA